MFEKLLLAPIITHLKLGGSLNRNCIVDVPDPFPAPYKRKAVWLRSTNIMAHTKVFSIKHYKNLVQKRIS